jgi:hypothetical protein
MDNSEHETSVTTMEHDSARLIGAWFPQVGTMIRRNGSGPFRKVVEIEEFAAVRRCWVSNGDYIDISRRGLVFVPQGEDGGPIG